MASSFKRNILLNGNFLINQRVYVSGTATASGTYMHDRWKSTTTNSNYTFTQGTPDTTITIAAGTIAQIVEDKNVAGGVYTLSWTGTATARIAINGGTTSGSYAASPITTSSANAGQTITVEFSTGTLGKIQLEPGAIATPYERQIYSDELVQCQRYCVNYNSATASGLYLRYLFGQNVLTTNLQGAFTLPVPMRITPTLTTTSTASNYAVYSNSIVTACSSVPLLSTDGCSNQTIAVNIIVASGLVIGYAGQLISNNNQTSYLLFTAEL
jgi:hypothetical protein